MSTGQIITPDSNDAAFAQLDTLAQPVVLQVPIGDGLFKTEVLGGLTKVQQVAAQLLEGILSNPKNSELPLIGNVETALMAANVLILRSEDANCSIDEFLQKFKRETAPESSQAGKQS